VLFVQEHGKCALWYNHSYLVHGKVVMHATIIAMWNMYNIAIWYMYNIAMWCPYKIAIWYMYNIAMWCMYNIAM